MEYLKGKSVLVTGGTGSFGKAFVGRLLADRDVRRVIVFSRDELKQYEMAQDVVDPRVRFFLGDVRDLERLRRACQDVDVIVHAAALKQIPAAEYNPFECIKTNVLGAQNVIEAALSDDVERVVALSTDKASNPINLYGATKLCSDKLFIAGNAYSAGHGSRMAVVRYGNVIGSRGSVVPFFLKQRTTGKLPITDLRMTRFWITLDQGVQLVLEALDRMHGGELFVPKIPSSDIRTLAEAVAPECEIEEIGIRPGEKLHEQLIGEDEARRTRDLGDLYVVTPDFPWWDDARNDDGRPVAADFSYRSDNNPDHLDVDGLRELLKKVDLL